MNEKPPAIALVRVSTDSQAKGSDSPQVQEDRIREWAKYAGHEVAAVYGQQRKGESGYTPAMEREDARQAIEHAIQLQCPLVVYSLSRLGRNARDLLDIGEYLVERGANLIGISDGLNLRLLRQSAVGKAMYGVQAIFAQWYRDDIAEKTRNQLLARKEAGRRTGGHIPWGWMIDANKTRTRRNGDNDEAYHSDLIPNPDELAIQREWERMVSLPEYQNGKGPKLVEIAERLNTQGITRADGTVIYPKTRKGKPIDAKWLSNRLREKEQK